MIRIFCRAADAILKETQTLTSGMTNYPEVVLTFSNDWNGFGKAVVVRAGNVYEDVLVTNNKFIIPHECLETAGVNLSVGVSGSNGTQTIPTIWCAVGEILEGTDVNEGANIGTATPTLVEQMLGYAEQCEEYAELMDTHTIRTVVADDDDANQYGTATVVLDDSGAGANRTLTFTFKNLKGNGITSLSFTPTGENKGRITVYYDNGSSSIYDGVKYALAAMSELDADVQAAELLRVAAEELRAAAETERASAETARASAEEGRAAAEEIRAYNETARVSAEESRDSAETARASAETSRASAETNRVAAESSRVTAEGERATAETARISAENSRIAAESIRDSEESARELAETSRASAESARASAESVRSTAESTRQTNESSRQTQESGRQSNENTRQSNESTRTSNEATRVENEAARVDAEEDRAEAESARILAEAERVEEFENMYDYANSVFQNDTLVLDHGTFLDDTLVL